MMVNIAVLDVRRQDGRILRIRKSRLRVTGGEDDRHAFMLFPCRYQPKTSRTTIQSARGYR